MKVHWASFSSGLTIGVVLGVIAAAGLFALLKGLNA
jgi:hypothetical protein